MIFFYRDRRVFDYLGCEKCAYQLQANEQYSQYSCLPSLIEESLPIDFNLALNNPVEIRLPSLIPIDFNLARRASQSISMRFDGN